MLTFITEDFLLHSDTARKLYFDYVQHLPIIDYHNHLSPADIANNKIFSTITKAWLSGDHYKWRAMRANGINENLITGDADDFTKFRAWSATVPFTMRNPLYHWTHLELKQLFNIHELLDEESAERIYTYSNHLLQTKFNVHEIFNHYKVELLCTTDNPTDNLGYHQQLTKTNLQTKVFPAFRPDTLINFSDKSEWLNQLNQLEQLTGSSIKNLDDFISVLENRINFFHDNGCRLSDHGLDYIPSLKNNKEKVKKTFFKLLNSKKIPGNDKLQSLKAYVLFELCKLYHSKNWTQQFHLGAMRNNSERLLNLAGKDAGADSIGDYKQAETLSRFLNELDKEDKLAKTIVYNLNPADNEVFATLAGNFNDGSVAGKIQWGSAWWFLDQKGGIEKQLNTLSNMNLLSRFVGMVTDSRSFLSFSRHDYFRRILSNLIGDDIEKGKLPYDLNFLGKMLADISYYNAKNYFGWKV